MMQNAIMYNDKFIVLGVGNTVMQDDGVGVKVVHALREGFDLPDNICIIDGGLAGFAWLEEIRAARYLLIVDAMRGDGPPGTVYRVTPDQLANRSGPTISPHEVGVTELLAMAEMLGSLPQTLILGVQPDVTTEPGLELTEALRDAVPRIVAAIIEELRNLGLEVSPKSLRESAESRTDDN